MHTVTCNAYSELYVMHTVTCNAHASMYCMLITQQGSGHTTREFSSRKILFDYRRADIFQDSKVQVFSIVNG